VFGRSTGFEGRGGDEKNNNNEFSQVSRHSHLSSCLEVILMICTSTQHLFCYGMVWYGMVARFSCIRVSYLDERLSLLRK
jgi:hypothetical protein